MTPEEEIWHELVLNGIGGQTVAEAKQKLTVSEFREWVKYRNLRGTLSTPRRLEQAIARACHLICIAAGIKKDADLNTPFSTIDFMPHEDGYQEAQREPTLEEFVARAIATGDL